MALAKSKFNNTAGFSLVEVMIATTLLAMSLTALAQLFAVATVSNRTAEHLTYAWTTIPHAISPLRPRRSDSIPVAIWSAPQTAG